MYNSFLTLSDMGLVPWKGQPSPTSTPSLVSTHNARNKEYQSTLEFVPAPHPSCLTLASFGECLKSTHREHRRSVILCILWFNQSHFWKQWQDVLSFALVSYYYYVIEAAVVSDVSKVYAQPLLASYHMPESKWTVSQWSNKVNKLDFAHGSDQPKMFKIP